MYYLYGSRTGAPRKLVATFDTEGQLLAYVNWAILKKNPNGTQNFEQGSALVGCSRFEFSDTPRTDEDDTQVFHNPTPSML
jgi:hypothetical protein